MRLRTLCTLMILCWMGTATANAQSGSDEGASGSGHEEFHHEVEVEGYADMEFRYDAPAFGRRDQSTFDQHRLVLSTEAEMSSALRGEAEVEYEHGGNAEDGGEVEVEEMTLDYRFGDGLTFRTGIIPMPLGRYNQRHDSPENDLTDRPLVDRQIIPTTLSEAGAGIFGRLRPSQSTEVRYQVYLVNGFSGGIIRPSDSLVRVRGGRGSVSADNNAGKSLVARVEYHPIAAATFGFSTHVGHYDDSGKALLTIVAIDGTYGYGPLELLGELAQLAADRDQIGLGRQTQRGYMLQGNYHFLRDRLMKGSIFTGVVRYDWVDFGVMGSPDERISRLTFGINFRPVEEAVFKTDFQTNWRKLPGMAAQREDYRFLASVATYF